MLSEEFVKKLKEHHSEEKNDVLVYSQMSKSAEDMGEHVVAGILRDIACDEKSHMEIIENILDWSGNK